MVDYDRSKGQGSTQRTPNQGTSTVATTRKTPMSPHDYIRQYPGPVGDRKITSVPPPNTFKPTEGQFFAIDPRDGKKKPNPTFLKEHFFKEGRLEDKQAKYIIERAAQILAKEPNMVEVKSPVTVCGDIHGQYYDLMKLFEVGGSLQDNTYLFLGDYVDRGDFGIECLLYLFALKIWDPTRIYLLRGNHECRHLTEYFTFKKECIHKYNLDIYEACIQSFCALPVAALVDNRFFCVHGGISPQLITLNDLNSLNRFQEPGSQGLLCDLLWADPMTNFGHETEPSANGPGLKPGTSFVNNSVRGCSYYYTYAAVCQFLERNNLLTVIRGHEAQDAGYTMHRKTPKKNFPSVITIFSAPNYCDAYKNRGAVLKYANKNITIRQYNSCSHPYWLPNFMNAFTWSLPFVGSKIADMLLAVLNICTEEEMEDSDDDGKEAQAAEEIAKRKAAIKRKILAVGKMQRVFNVLREEAEKASELSTETTIVVGDPDNQLSVVKNKQIRSFADARALDSANERLPSFETGGERSDFFPAPSMRVAGHDNAETEIRRRIREEFEKDDDALARAHRNSALRRNVTAPGRVG